VYEFSIPDTKVKSHTTETFFPDTPAYLRRKLSEDKIFWLLRLLRGQINCDSERTPASSIELCCYPGREVITTMGSQRLALSSNILWIEYLNNKATSENA